ncbi:hypothetical protein ACFL5L_00545 [candidate division KSB1 bacterium]
MLMTILASIGLFFIIVYVYRRGKRDGIKKAIDYFLTEMNRKQIDFKIIDDYNNMGKKARSIIYNKVRYLMKKKQPEKTGESIVSKEESSSSEKTS